MTRWALVALTAIFLPLVATAKKTKAPPYGEWLCQQSGYTCVILPEDNSLEQLFPDHDERLMIQKINRNNRLVKKGMVIAVPADLKGKTLMDFCPFATEDLRGRGTKLMVFDPALLAWAVYNQSGQLVRWGPASGGADWCDDIRRRCHTMTGVFKIEEKYGPEKRSVRYPLGCHGKTCAPMPFFMKFHWSGAGFHGSLNLPGRNDSHGCVRLFPDDAEWLNKNFIEIGTWAIVLPYPK